MGIESFQTDNPDFAGESFTKGWEYIIGTSLKEFLEKEQERLLHNIFIGDQLINSFFFVYSLRIPKTIIN